jgi:MFS family permease
VPSPIAGERQSFTSYLKAIPNLLRANPALQQLLYVRSLLALGKLSVPFLAVYAIQRFQLEPGYVATYTAIMLGSQSVSALGWGYLADRLNYRWLWLFSAVIVLVQAVLALMAPTAWWFIPIFLLIGLNLGAESAALPHTLYSVSPPAETTRVIGLTNTVLAPILAAGPVIGGALINQYSYTAALLAAVVVAAIGVAGTLLWLVPQLAANRRQI